MDQKPLDPTSTDEAANNTKPTDPLNPTTPVSVPVVSDESSPTHPVEEFVEQPEPVTDAEEVNEEPSEQAAAEPVSPAAESAPEISSPEPEVTSGGPFSAPVSESVIEPAVGAKPEPVTQESSSGLPPMQETPAEAPIDTSSEDFAPRFEEAKESSLDNVPVAASGAFAGGAVSSANQAMHGDKSETSGKKSPDPISANSKTAGTVNQEHSHSKKLLILVATLIGLMLAAAVIYIYMTSNKSAVPVSGTPSSNIFSASPEELGASIDQSQQDLDSLSEADFNEEDLSDSTLGL
ncbi:MAG: hypothetical protein M3Q70_00830 [bacterium]|nr:hypothetical protein [bacterium]